MENKQEDEECLAALDNVNRKILAGKHEYLLLFKRQRNKNYLTLYVTDFDENFWVQKIDRPFLEKLRDGLSINTELLLFCSHLAKSFQNSSSSLKREAGGMKIQTKLQIGQGLVMTCSFLIDNRISQSEKPQDHKIIMQLFLKQLYEAKESQIQVQRGKWKKMLEQQQDKVLPAFQKVDPTYVKEVLQGNLKKSAKDVKSKNRSLMNPNQKRHKQATIKFEGEQGGQ